MWPEGAELAEVVEGAGVGFEVKAGGGGEETRVCVEGALMFAGGTEEML